MVSEVYGQNGDRVSKYDKSGHICNMKQNQYQPRNVLFRIVYELAVLRSHIPVSSKRNFPASLIPSHSPSLIQGLVVTLDTTRNL